MNTLVNDTSMKLLSHIKAWRVAFLDSKLNVKYYYNNYLMASMKRYWTVKVRRYIIYNEHDIIKFFLFYLKMHRTAFSWNLAVMCWFLEGPYIYGSCITVKICTSVLSNSVQLDTFFCINIMNYTIDFFATFTYKRSNELINNNYNF